MESVINDRLTERERAYVKFFRFPGNVPYRKPVYRVLCWLVPAAAFLIFAIAQDRPVYLIGTYALFLAWMALQVIGARSSDSPMPQIIQKYEDELRALQETQ